jgi:tellurite resistance protein
LIDSAEVTARARVEEWSLSEAFVALLIAGARADGSVSVQEANGIEHVIAGMKVFRGSRPEALQPMIAKIVERIEDHGGDVVVRTAAAAIPKELRATAFAVVFDVMLSDGSAKLNEKHFASELQSLLDIDDDTAARIMDVIRTKNAG